MFEGRKSASPFENGEAP